MADYFVGDIQGCFNELQALLNQVSFNPDNDKLYVAGDIVARGKQSLETIRLIKSLGNSAQTVLGNHDLHLLAIAEGLKNAKKADLLDEILTAPDKIDLIEWLAQQPLLTKLPNEQVYLSHAGISPQWSVSDAINNAIFAEQKLQGNNRANWLTKMYGENPNNWLNVSNDSEKFRFIINAFARMRFCFNDSSLEFATKSAPEMTDKNQLSLTPWYKLVQLPKDCYWLFGHWASLMGQCSNPQVYALDTGCVWGQHLTLLRWQDKTIFTEKAHTNS